jgi:multidrug efflux pump subunit AcrB
MQRLQVDQFPNVDFPVVVISTDYPGASPEIVESEVTKKIEEGVNSIAGINALTSRSYESQSVVIIEFGLHMDGRKAADDVREKVAAIRATLRDEVKEPRVLRFDPASRAIWSVAVLPDASAGAAFNAVELTNWAEQTLKKRLENVRGVGSVALVGGSQREINIYLNPQALASHGITPEQVASAVRNENQDYPVGSIRSSTQDRVIQIAARVQRPEDFGRIIVTRKNGAPVRVDQLAEVKDGAQEIESLALYNGQRTLLLNVQKAQDENTIAVVDGLNKTLAELQQQLPPGVKLTQITDGSRQIRVSVSNVRQTLFEGALLTVLIVFLFLNSWRSTVITGLTLPIALIGSFFFMNLLGYDKTIGRITALFDQGTDALVDVYQGILRWALDHKLSTVALAVAIFVSSIFMVPLLGTEFVPKSDFSETNLTFHTPVGSSLEVTEARARQVEGIIRAFPEVNYTLTTINTGNAQGKMYASIYIRLVDRKQRTRSVDEMSTVLRQRLREVPGIDVTHVGLLDPVGGQKQIAFSIQGADMAELSRLNALALEKIRIVPGLVDLDSSLKPDKPTLDVKVRRDAASDLGLGVAQVGSALRTLVAGQTVGNWRAPDDQTYDVNVRLSHQSRNQPQDLNALPFTVGTQQDGSARVVRLDQVASVIESTGSNQINRRDLTREVAITGNVSGRSAGEVSADIKTAMDSIAMPPGYSYKFSGSVKDMAEAFAYALSALALAVIFIYMILASQFKSFFQPLALMTALPLTLIGVVLALMLFNSTLSMFSVIGVVMLMGLVTKNAILLVDFAIRAREDGSNRHDALLMAAKVRLRPILMTTLAMIFGMVPLAFALSEGSEMRAPMGQAVIGGVITSSLLTLVVVPVVYCYMDDLAQWLRKFWRQPAAKAAQTKAIDGTTS